MKILKTQLKTQFKTAAAAGFPFLYTFVFLNGVIRPMDEDSPWISFAYFYGLGWMVFVYFSWILFRIGGVNWKRADDRFWFTLVSVGIFLMGAGHALWIYLAVSSPYKGF